MASEALLGGLTLGDAPAKPRERKRRSTKENIAADAGFLSVQSMVSGTDQHGIRIRMFTAGQQRQRARLAGVSEYKYEGGTIPSTDEGVRLPGQARHGEGSMSDEVGNKFHGQWANDKRSGQGKYTFACGDTYEGEWLDGMYHGHGKYSSKDSDEYEGQWSKDRMSGHGKFFYRELGDVYEGDWEGGFREGSGKYTCADGTIFIGQYEVHTPLQPHACWRVCSPEASNHDASASAHALAAACGHVTLPQRVAARLTRATRGPARPSSDGGADEEDQD